MALQTLDEWTELMRHISVMNNYFWNNRIIRKKLYFLTWTKPERCMEPGSKTYEANQKKAYKSPDSTLAI